MECVAKTSKIRENAYTEPEILKTFDQAQPIFKAVLSDEFNLENAGSVTGEVREELRALTPLIPRISRNPLVFLITTGCAQYLALSRILKKYGMDSSDCGRIIHRVEEKKLKSIPAFIRRIIGRVLHTPLGRWIIRRAYVKSCSAPDSPYRIEAEFIKGDGKNFDFGVDFYHCGIQRFFHEQDADDIMPYICEMDHIQARHMNIGFRRTETMPSGACRCNFRWKKSWRTT